MKLEFILCDLCKTEKKKDGHWTHAFGKVQLLFKDVAALQTNYEYPDCCSTCATKLRDAVVKVVERIKTEADTKELLFKKD